MGANPGSTLASSWLSKLTASTGTSIASMFVLWLLILAALMQPLFFVAAVLDEEFEIFYEPATFPADQWLRPIAGILVIVGLYVLRSRPALLMILALMPWLVGFLTSGLVRLIQGGTDRWVDIASSDAKSVVISLATAIETTALTVAVVIGSAWVLTSQIGARLEAGNSMLRISEWLVAPIGTHESKPKQRKPLRKSQVVLAVALFLFAAVGLLKMAEPFSSEYFLVTYPGGELPADQWLRVFFYLIFAALVIVGLGTPIMLPILAAFAFLWNTYLETPVILIVNSQQDRLLNYRSLGFDAIDGLHSLALSLAVLVGIWVVAEGLILQYKKRVMAWAEARSDHYAGLDLPAAGPEVKQQVSTLAVFGLIFAFLIPVVGLILSYAARNDIVLSKGHKTGFDMAVTASIIGWALLLVQILALVFLTVTGGLASLAPWLFVDLLGS